MTEHERYAPLRSALEQFLRITEILEESPEGARYLARDLTLERSVLVRALDRSRAGGTAAETFAREARVLASLSDPGIPAIHHAGAVGEFRFIVLEPPDGPTLEERLARGPLPPREVLRVGVQLLGALDATHGAGFAHGTVEARWVILGESRVVLDGFGHASELTDEAMRADLEAVARLMQKAAGGTLTGPVGSAVVRALGLASERRLGAEAFRALLENAERGPARRRPGRWAALGTALLLAAAYVGVSAWNRPGPPGPAPRQLAVLPLDVDGGQSLDPLGTNLAYLIQHGLEEVPGVELTPRGPVDLWWEAQARAGQPVDGFAAARALRAHWIAHGVVNRRSDGTLRVRLSLYDSAGTSRALPEVRTPADDLAALGDSLALAVLRVLAPPADRGLEPGGFAGVPLPALKAFLQGESAFARDAWALAQRHYETAIGLDSTFALADWRLANIKRWRRLSHGPDLAAVYARHASQLRARDRLLIEALLQPDLDLRLALLDSAIQRRPADGYARLLQGEEVFHLGPLAGHGMDEALAIMAAAVARDSSLALAYDHLVLGQVRFGRREAAHQALALRRRVGSAGRRDDLDMLPFLELVYDERFVPWRAWLRYHYVEWRGDPRQLEAIERIARFGTPWLDMPRTQLRYSDLLLRAGPPRPETHATAHQGKGMALFALGRIHEALAELDSAAALFDTPEARLQQAEWRAVPAAFGYPGLDAASWTELLTGLAHDSTLGPRAAWALALLAADDTAVARSWLARMPAGSPLRTLGEARLAAGRGDLRAALALTDSVRMAFQQPRPPDPFAVAAFHLQRGEWLAALGEPARADREWLWYEASDVEGWPQGLAQAGEVGATFGPFARLERARTLLDANFTSADTARACAHVRRVRELWSEADSSLRRLAHTPSFNRACPP
ncbi:MAG TPA: hypothetical protein VH764_06545 [Gemmatimonadales bacterium]